MEEKQEGLLSFRLNTQTNQIEYVIIKDADLTQSKPKKKKTARKKKTVVAEKVEPQEQLRKEQKLIELSIQLLEEDPNLHHKAQEKKEEPQVSQAKIDDQAAINYQTSQAQKLDSLLHNLIIETNESNVPTNQTMDQISSLVSSLCIETLMILCYPQKLNFLHKLTDFDSTMTPFVCAENKYVEELLMKEQTKHFSSIWKRFCPDVPLPAYDFSLH